MHPPENSDGRQSPRLPAGSSDHQNDQTTTSSPATPTESIARTMQVMDDAAVLASDLATLATRTGWARDARAATHLCEAAHQVWMAAMADEALAEGVTR